MRALRVVEHEEPVQRPLQSRGRAEVVPTKRNAPVFMQNRALQALHESVGPRMPRLRPRVAHLVVGTGGDEAGFELLAVVGQHARQAPAGSPIAVQGRTPRRLVTDKLRSYAAAHRTVMPSIVHSTPQYENNRAEVSHQPTRQREGQMRRFKSVGHAQRFLSVHGPVQNLFRVGRHLLRAAHYRLLRTLAFVEWDAVTCGC